MVIVEIFFYFGKNLLLITFLFPETCENGETDYIHACGKGATGCFGSLWNLTCECNKTEGYVQSPSGIKCIACKLNYICAIYFPDRVSQHRGNREVVSKLRLEFKDIELWPIFLHISPKEHKNAFYFTEIALVLKIFKDLYLSFPHTRIYNPFKDLYDGAFL